MPVQTRLIVSEAGEMAIETFSIQPVTGRVRDFLKNDLQLNTTTITPNLGSTRFASEFRLAYKGVAFVGTPVLAAFLLTGLNFRSAWKTEDGVLRPDFAQGSAEIDPSALGTLQCPFPDFVQVWLMFSFPYGEVSPGKVSPYLYARVPAPEGGSTTHRWGILPLPNTHEDGSLCYGTYPDLYELNAPIPVATRLLETWMTSPWNNDLFGVYSSKVAKFKELFSWTPEGNLIPQSPATWTRCTVASSPSGLIQTFMEQINAEQAWLAERD